MGKFTGILLASDMDDTYLTRGTTVGRGNVQAIEAFMAEGGLFTVATGRSLQGFATIEPLTVYNTPCVLFNGSYVYDYKTKQILRETPLTGSYRRDCQAITDAFGGQSIEIHTLDTTYVHRPNEINEKHFQALQINAMETKSLDDIPNPWLKALFADEHETLIVIQQHVRQHYNDKYDCIFSHKYLLELQDKQASKGCQVAWLAEHLNAHTVYTAGDGENDLSMAERFPFFAPSNATQAAKNAATKIFCDVEEGAITEIIAHIEKIT